MSYDAPGLPTLYGTLALLCPEARDRAARELSKYRSHARSEAFAEAAELLRQWTAGRLSRANVNHAVWELEVKAKCERELAAAEPSR